MKYIEREDTTIPQAVRTEKNGDIYAKLIKVLDDEILALIIGDAREDGRSR